MGGSERSDSKHVDGNEGKGRRRASIREQATREESGKSQRKEGGRKEEERERASGGSEWKEGAESVI